MLSDRTAKDIYYSGKTIFREPPPPRKFSFAFSFFFFFFPTPTSCSVGSLIVHPATRGKFPSPSQYFLSSRNSHRNRLIVVSPPFFVSLPPNSFASQEEGYKQSLPITAMFTSSLRRQSPALLRLTPLSIRALTSSSSSKSAFVRSRPLKTAILSSSSAQRRFFAISSYLRDEASASAQLADLDPPAGEYAHSGHGHEHHFKNQGPITRFQQLADHGLVNPALINTITKGLGYDEMTKVQQKTILETVNGENVYVSPITDLFPSKQSFSNRTQ